MLLGRRSYLAFPIVSFFVLAACSSSEPPRVQPVAEAPVVPPSGVPASALGRGIYKLGHPYQVGGTWYYPAENQTYDETGIASWYGPNFHENYTANGEVFDQNTITAAHRTLPLPSVVQVTNLDNGRMIEVRINDRGPFIGDRIIDLSRRSAQLLGFERQGTAKVRVRYLVPESLTAQSIARTNNAAEGFAAAPAAVPTAVVTAQALPPVGGAASSSPPPEPAYRRPTPSSADRGYTSETLTPPPSYSPSYGRAPPVQVAAAAVEPDHILRPPHGGAPGPALPQHVTVVPVGPTHIYIQAGAFGVSDNAARMKQRLTAIGPVNVMTTRVNGLTIYRVRLGPITSVDDADRMRQQAVQAGATQARIVVD